MGKKMLKNVKHVKIKKKYKKKYINTVNPCLTPFFRGGQKRVKKESFWTLFRGGQKGVKNSPKSPLKPLSDFWTPV